MAALAGEDINPTSSNLQKVWLSVLQGWVYKYSIWGAGIACIALFIPCSVQHVSNACYKPLLPSDESLEGTWKENDCFTQADVLKP